jgi:hypothetical protein
MGLALVFCTLWMSTLFLRLYAADPKPGRSIGITIATIGILGVIAGTLAPVRALETFPPDPVRPVLTAAQNSLRRVWGVTFFALPSVGPSSLTLMAIVVVTALLIGLALLLRRLSKGRTESRP